MPEFEFEGQAALVHGHRQLGILMRVEMHGHDAAGVDDGSVSKVHARWSRRRCRSVPAPHGGAAIALNTHLIPILSTCAASRDMLVVINAVSCSRFGALRDGKAVTHVYV